VPDLGQVPEIDVPSYLPDLPGIAADLMYSADLGPGIAPSAPSSAIPELPTFSTESVEPSQAGISNHHWNFQSLRSGEGFAERRWNKAESSLVERSEGCLWI